jgi:predicted nucleotidyltransferase
MHDIDESQTITLRAIDTATSLFESLFGSGDCALYSWGSMSRREMGPYSDSDLIIVGYPPAESITRYRETLGKELPYHRVDLLEQYNPYDLYRIAKIDGTDRQAVLYTRNESKKPSREFEELASKIKADTRGNLRELLHVFANRKFVYPDLFGQQNLKFSPGFLKDFYFAYLVARHIYGDSVSDTHSAINRLSGDNYLTAASPTDYIDAFNLLLFMRNHVQQFRESEQSIFTTEAFSGSSQIKPKDAVDMVKYFGTLIGRELDDILIEMSRTGSNYDVQKFLEHLLSKEEISELDVKRIIESGDEISAMLLAYRTKDPRTLETLRRMNLQNWYVIYGIANNPHASEETLFRLMVPENPDLVDLYTDFAWRNIYLYVARNKSSTEIVRQHIIRYKNARPMDIAAASRED